MLDARTKQTIDNACDTLVGRVPSPQTQVDIITTALIYKFMDDMDLDGLELSGKRTFFVGDLEPYAFSTIVNTKGNQERMNLYLTGLEKVQIAKTVPELFRCIFKEAMIPFRDPTTFALFLKEINELKYDDSETIGDAFEYLLNKMATAKNAGQFRTPRNIIDFIVDVVKPTKDDTILDPACGTAGFLISAYKHITSGGKLTPDELKRVTNSIVGMDIDPTMVKLSLVNLYLHKFEQPNIYEYDTLSNDTRWGDRYDVILANPPFMTPKGGITPHKRFAINANRSEVLFVDYFMEHLTINGRAGFVVPEGIIFQTANAYKNLRKMMLDGYLYAVVSLPSGVFNPYAGVKTSILFFDRAFAKQNKDILFVRVDNDGFSLGAQRAPIKQNDLPEALKIINEYRDGKDVSGYERAMVVSKERIAENNYDLTAAKYVEKEIVQCNYEMVRLGDVAEVSSGNSAPQDSALFEDGIYPFCRTSDVGKVHISNNFSEIQDKLNKNGVKGLKLFKKGTILFPKSGASILLNHRVLLAVDSYVSSHLATIYADTTKALPEYLFALLCKVDARDLVPDTGYPSLKCSDLANIEIPLPPLDVQQQIVDEIENKQSAINHAREIIKNLERERQYFACLLDGIDCKEVPLEKIFVILRNGKNVNQIDEVGKYKVSRIQTISNWDVNLEKTKYTNDDVSDDFFVKKDDILLSHINSIEHLAKSAIYKSDVPLVHGVNLIRCVPDKRVAFPDYIAYAMKSLDFIENARKYAQKAVNQASIKISDLKTVTIPLPSIDDQKRIVAKLEAEQEIIDANKRLIDLMQDKINQVINRIYKCDL